MQETYKIVRFHRNRSQTVISRGLTLKEAKEHCSLESTHKRDKDGSVSWFDGYTLE